MGDRRAPVYVVKPSVEFRQPFRFDFDKPSSRDYQSDEVTDHFNYGFSEMTMNTYVKKLRLAVKTLDKTLNSEYVVNGNGNLRLNDEIPMDFGGFNNFYDTKLVRNDVMPGLENNSDELINFFIENHASADAPLLSFIKSMYPPEGGQEYFTLDSMITQMENNIEHKYAVMMNRKEEIQRVIKGPQQIKRLMKEQQEQERQRQRLMRERDKERKEHQRERSERDRDRDRDRNRDRDGSDSRRKDKRKEKSSKKSKDKSRSRDSRKKSKDRKRSKDHRKKDKDRKRSRSRNRSPSRPKKKHRD